MTDAGASPNRKVRVLIADDFSETRRSVRIMLSMNPNVTVVAMARNGAEAVELAREHHPDVVIMDVNMPKVDGLAAYKEISQTHPDTGCIIISAQRDMETLNTAMSVGAQEYLGKPFTIEELNDAVDRVAALVEESRKKLAEAGNLNKKTDTYLKRLAGEYAKSKRTDDEAIGVFEQLAENPECEMVWLRTLAMLYIIREEWGKLKDLAGRLELQKK